LSNDIASANFGSAGQGSIRKPRIAVYCSSSQEIEAKYLDFAHQVGSSLVQAGFDLVWGGGQISMMGSVSRGAREAGGATFGVIPEKLLNREFIDEDATEIFIVPDMRSRKGKIEELSDGFLALPGGIGTFEEFFEIWVGGYLGFHQKPIAMCDPFNDWKLIQDAISHLASIKMIKGGQEELVLWSNDLSAVIGKFKDALL
jgi:uncharacterized protein (TIGR00730 family)